MQNLAKRKSPFIDTFDPEGPVVINVMRDLIVGFFEHLDITSKMDLDIKPKYMEHILRGTYPKKFLQKL